VPLTTVLACWVITRSADREGPEPEWDRPAPRRRTRDRARDQAPRGDDFWSNDPW
jgi:hypothetical protein